MGECHKAMTFEEYLIYPRKLGWKYEAERQELLQLPTAPAIRELVNYWVDRREQLEAQGPSMSEDLV